MSPGSGEDEPLSLHELARRAGVVEGTLRSWEQRADRPLRTDRQGPRDVTATIADLRVFCAVHSELPAARRALARLDSPSPSPDAVQSVLGVALAAVRAATAAQLEVAQNGATIADNAMVACRAHAAALSTALASLDDALSRVQPTGRSADR